MLNQNLHRVDSGNNHENLIAAITPTNRNPDKMTTLVMTGVTALVRATAYKMEINGVLTQGKKSLNG